MRLEWAPPALRELAHLPKAIQQRVVGKMEWFLVQNDPLGFAKPLRNSELGSHRFRVGDYRVIVDVMHGHMTVLLVLAVRHRKDAYRL